MLRRWIVAPQTPRLSLTKKEEWVSDGLWDLVCIQIGPEAFYEDSDCNSEGELEKEMLQEKRMVDDVSACLAVGRS